MSLSWRVGDDWEACAHGVQEVGVAWRGEQPTLLEGTVKNWEQIPASQEMVVLTECNVEKLLQEFDIRKGAWGGCLISILSGLVKFSWTKP